MKRIILLLLFAAILLAACGEKEEAAVMVQPVSFYYRATETDFSSEDGVIRAEVRDLGAERYTDQKLFELYLEGPERDDLVSPFSQDTTLSSVVRRGGTLEFVLTRNAYSPSEFDHSIAYACLAKTGLALDGIYKIRIEVWTKGGTLVDSVFFSENDILLYDSGAEKQNIRDVTLYYSDEAGKLLLTEKQSISNSNWGDVRQNAQNVLELLLSSPQSGGMRMALPAGTAILDDVNVENGVCTVDFNGDFYLNRPDDEQAEQLTILSVVNTLCELDGINAVQIYSQGQILSPYVWLDLSEAWTMDSSVVGPLHEELGEFAGMLCLPGQNDGLLHRLTIRARARGSTTKEEALLLALFSRMPQNGLAAPFSNAPAPLSVTTSNQICTVELAENSLPTDPDALETAVHSIAATLTSLPEVNAVLITEGGRFVTLGALTPSASWFCVQREIDDFTR